LEGQASILDPIVVAAGEDFDGNVSFDTAATRAKREGMARVEKHMLTQGLQECIDLCWMFCSERAGDGELDDEKEPTVASSHILSHLEAQILLPVPDAVKQNAF
jgi:hypothetical protein